MINAVIAGYSRSPFTIANKGELVSVRPEDMLSEVIKNLVVKSKINPEDIEDIIAGCAFPNLCNKKRIPILDKRAAGSSH